MLRVATSRLLICLFVCKTAAVSSCALAQAAARSTQHVLTARDSLNIGADTRQDARECLQTLCWKPTDFRVIVDEPKEHGPNAIIRFPSAAPVGIRQNDTVIVEWYTVDPKRDWTQQPRRPAMVVVHESGRNMTAGRAIARGLRDRGLHTFMVQLPFYGRRRPSSVSEKDRSFADFMKQAIADVRRTRDAVAVLSQVDNKNISLQGTSLGGFISATTAGLDSAYKNVFILLAGGDVATLIETGKHETAGVRLRLEQQGYDRRARQELMYQFEPNRLAHRLDPKRTWLFSAVFDRTVPPQHADSFATAVGLDKQHHVRLPADHYSGVIFLPTILDRMAVAAGGRPRMAHSTATFHGSHARHMPQGTGEHAGEK